MRIPLLRTLSGRIILGFTVLTLTFGTVSALIVLNMELLSREIRSIRTAYLPLALETKNLDEKQNILWSYITNELLSESRPERVERQLIRHRQGRSKSLRATEKILNELDDLPAAHSAKIARTRQFVAGLRRELARQGRYYKVLLQAPPLESLVDQPDLSAAERARYQEAARALEQLRANESELRARIQFLAREQSDQAREIALTLERNEHRLRLFAISLGVTAVLIGLLITIWATMTLRPLQRLRDAARRIARGEYGSRIDEKGPAEVADLAREFNVMGRAIEERERELVRQERLVAVGKMAAMITHEVRNPLSALGLNTELLEEELSALSDATEAKHLCQAITTEVDRLTAITEEYLQFARLPKPKLQPEDLNAIVRNLVDFQQEQLALRGIELRVVLADDIPPARVDDAQLRQALLNLVRNAAEAVSENGGGHVTLGSRLARGGSGDMIEVFVRDSGPGIPEEAAAKLFEPFFSTKEGGTGLGLALTHQIIREHGGEIHVDSQPGRGATFVLALPRA